VDHPDFAPVRHWILEGKGFLVYGGSKYMHELTRMTRYLKLVRLLKDARRAYEIDAAEVDRRQKEIVTLTGNTVCNDQHVIAILSVSGCVLLCSGDAESDKFVKNPLFYRRGRKPKIYRSRRHERLLCDRSLVGLYHVT
jgi:hypothetical protein